MLGQLSETFVEPRGIVMDEVAAQFAARIRDKDPQALVEFIELRKPQLLAFIERNLSARLGASSKATDILQEVSLSAVGSLPTFELGDRDPFSWLCQLAEHKIIDAHRKLVAAQKRSADREQPTPASGTEHAARAALSTCSWSA